MVADDAALDHSLAEPTAALVVAVQKRCAFAVLCTVQGAPL